MTRARVALLAIIAAAALVAGSLMRHEKPLPPHLSIQPGYLLADGYDTAILSIESDAPGRPRISVQGGTVEEISGKWQARIRAGVMPGVIRVRVEFPGYPPATAEVASAPDKRDSADDGTPDFLRLQDDHDQRAFRRWFTFLAEVQYFQPASQRPAEINDCAALIRYAYREALRRHDGTWADAAQLPFAPALDSIAKYQYPYTPLGASLFRARDGPFETSFLQFADAQTLRRFNTYSLGRDLSRALPGDLLFFRQNAERATFHGMIYIGESQIRNDGRRYVVYHTGAETPEIKRLTLAELRQFPGAEWRPLAGNPSFLGVSRWNILRKERQ